MSMSDKGQKWMTGVDAVLIISSLLLLLTSAFHVPLALTVVCLCVICGGGIGLTILSVYEIKQANRKLSELNNELKKAEEGRHRDRLRSLRTFLASDNVRYKVLSVCGIVILCFGLFVLVKKLLE